MESLADSQGVGDRRRFKGLEGAAAAKRDERPMDPMIGILAFQPNMRRDSRPPLLPRRFLENGSPAGGRGRIGEPREGGQLARPAAGGPVGASEAPSSARSSS
jgi:hypothetical protein